MIQWKSKSGAEYRLKLTRLEKKKQPIYVIYRLPYAGMGTQPCGYLEGTTEEERDYSQNGGKITNERGERFDRLDYAWYWKNLTRSDGNFEIGDRCLNKNDSP